MGAESGWSTAGLTRHQNGGHLKAARQTGRSYNSVISNLISIQTTFLCITHLQCNERRLTLASINAVQSRSGASAATDWLI